jgi:hypothetical protein
MKFRHTIDQSQKIAKDTMPTRSTQNVHALFKKNRFEAGIDYKTAFRDAAVLATRLMNSPQGLQHDYCFFFGINTPSIQPPGLSTAVEPQRRPMQYSCDKGIGELDAADIAAVERERLKLADRVRYRVVDLDPGSIAETRFRKPMQCQNETGIRSDILISRKLYNVAFIENRRPEEDACVRLLLAATLLHEVAHAAHNHLFGRYRWEDFREASIVAEAGYEYEARLFGLRPSIPRDNLANSSWKLWQHSRLESPSTMKIICLDESKLLQDQQDIWMDPAFVMKLCDDDFWSGEYIRDGAVALVPWTAAECSREINANILRVVGDVKENLKIPQSISDLFRSGGPSYAKVLYSQSSNPGHVLRGQKHPDKVIQKAGNKRTRDDSDTDSNADSDSDWCPSPKRTKKPVKKPVKKSVKKPARN